MDGLALVIVGAITAAVIAWQAWETRKAAMAGREGAEAARSSSQALVKAERPWVSLTVYNQSFRMQATNRLDWRISNEGRTVANIIEAQFRCRKIGPLDTALASPPNYGEVIRFYDIPIAPGNHLDAWSYVEAGRGAPDGLNAQDIEDIRSRGHDLVAFGFLRYRDQFGQEHESRFCYYYAVAFQDFRVNLRVPADYHRCT